jgi:Glycosyl transferase family 2
VLPLFLRRQKNPRFSVIVATYNRSRFIVPTLESALRQTHPPSEIIVVGDGCTDDSEQVIRQTFPRTVRWIGLSEHSRSQSAPNNAGIKAARGTHIAYLGHDDIWSPQHLEMLATVLDDRDFAVSGCIFHGPPGSMYYQFTGLFDDSAAAAHEFFPPSSIAHRRDLIARLGQWRDPREIKPPVDCEFLLRAAHAGCSFKSTNAISVHKFAAGHRYLSYRWPSCEEQKQMLEALRSPAGESGVLTRVMRDILAGATTTPVRHFDFDPFPPGELFRRNLCAKGLRQFPIERLEGQRTFVLDDSPAGLDWFPLEANSHDPFRWSGPNPNPRYFLPITCATAVRTRLRIPGFADDSLANVLTIELNDVFTPMEIKRESDGTFQFSATFPGPVTNGLKLQFHLPHNFWQRDYSPPRFAGFALSQIEVEPVH